MIKHLLRLTGRKHSDGATHYGPLGTAIVDDNGTRHLFKGKQLSAYEVAKELHPHDKPSQEWVYHWICRFKLEPIPRKRSFGILFNSGAWWIGAHYSQYNKRLCINLLPCLTIWTCAADGKEP